MAPPQAFEFVVDALVTDDAWESDGLPFVRSLLDDALNAKDEKKIQQVVYEACWRVVRGDAASGDMVALFAGRSVAGHKEILIATLADVCW
jgi:hypothetical protein